MVAAWNNKGNALFDLGRVSEAQDAFEEALRLDPTLAHAWNGKGDVRYERALYRKAIEAYSEALRLSPTDQHALRGKANALRHVGRKAEAAALDEQRKRLSTSAR